MFVFLSGARYYGYSQFGQGSGRILLQVNCIGSETRFSDCPQTMITDFDAAGCYHHNEISLKCYGMRSHLYKYLINNFATHYIIKKCIL